RNDSPSGPRHFLALEWDGVLLGDRQQRSPHERPRLHLSGGTRMSAPAAIPLLLRIEDRTAFPCLACPATGQPLARSGNLLVTPDRARAYPIVREIPRFVTSDHYVGSFSFEWNVHDRTQLDRFRSDDSSERIFREKTGLTPADVRGKLVLDAGIGAGRFADVLARWGAIVVGVDLSYAVEAANVTFGEMPNVLVCQ